MAIGVEDVRMPGQRIEAPHAEKVVLGAVAHSLLRPRDGVAILW